MHVNHNRANFNNANGRSFLTQLAHTSISDLEDSFATPNTIVSSLKEIAANMDLDSNVVTIGEDKEYSSLTDWFRDNTMASNILFVIYGEVREVNSTIETNGYQAFITGAHNMSSKLKGIARFVLTSTASMFLFNVSLEDMYFDCSGQFDCVNVKWIINDMGSATYSWGLRTKVGGSCLLDHCTLLFTSSIKPKKMIRNRNALKMRYSHLHLKYTGSSTSGAYMSFIQGEGDFYASFNHFKMENASPTDEFDYYLFYITLSSGVDNLIMTNNIIELEQTVSTTVPTSTIVMFVRSGGNLVNKLQSIGNSWNLDNYVNKLPLYLSNCSSSTTTILFTDDYINASEYPDDDWIAEISAYANLTVSVNWYFGIYCNSSEVTRPGYSISARQMVFDTGTIFGLGAHYDTSLENMPRNTVGSTSGYGFAIEHDSTYGRLNIYGATSDTSGALMTQVARLTYDGKFYLNGIPGVPASSEKPLIYNTATKEIYYDST